MVNISDVRTGVAEVLKDAGFNAKDYTVEAAPAPVVFVVPGDPYISEGKVFGGVQVNLSLLFIIGKGTNKAVADKADQTIQSAILALEDYTVEAVGTPSVITHQGAAHIAVVITLNSEIRNLEAI